ncbi:LysR family transcriptional regulator [Photobacterium sp. SDRW27]|uniref:LysR family transcriptional regulator n=1 Tax=Photobacterium obscurum TaxID=2829490 RepID=UPI002243F1CB|nr:LysR family transcriptional regulator [Photobacterium obscurum]MCW8327630.1 LysR family transcriptional regulator [Photobacterium obscurum]
MKTEDLALFTIVVKYGSQSAAAKALGIQESKVSRHITQLEQQLGTSLIRRNTRPLSLTDAGIELMERSQKILAEVEALLLSVGQMQGQPEGIVTVAAPLDFIDMFWSEALTKLLQRYPALQVKFISYQSRQNPMDMQADLVIYTSNENPPDSSMVGRPLLTLERGFVASPDFIARHPELTHPKQLEDYPCLLSAKGAHPANIWLWSENNKSHRLEVKGPLESETLQLCISTAVHGLGVIWVPPHLCGEHLKEGRLKLMFNGQYATRFTTWGLYPGRHFLPHRVRVVLNFFQEEFAQLQQRQFYE